MNHLNSVIIEGKAVSMPDTTENSTVFVLRSVRYIKDANGENRSESFDISIHSKGRLAECITEQIDRIGRGVRVVGRLFQAADGFAIMAEHVEFKPVFND